MYLPGDEGLKLAAAAAVAAADAVSSYLNPPCFSLKFTFSSLKVPLEVKGRE